MNFTDYIKTTFGIDLPTDIYLDKEDVLNSIVEKQEQKFGLLEANVEEAKERLQRLEELRK